MKRIITALAAICVAAGANAQYFSGSEGVKSKDTSSYNYNGAVQEAPQQSGTLFGVTDAFTSKKSAGSKSSPKGEKLSTSRLYLSYDSPKYIGKVDGYSDKIETPMRGFSLGYLNTRNLMNEYLQFNWGIEMSTAFSNVNKSSYDITTLGFNIPLYASSSISLSNNIKFIPYFGFNIGIGVLANKEEVEDYGYNTNYNMYNDENRNRGSFGVRYGFGFQLQKLYLGLGWQNDMTNTYYDDDDEYSEKYRKMSLSVGVCF